MNGDRQDKGSSSIATLPIIEDREHVLSFSAFIMVDYI